MNNLIARSSGNGKLFLHIDSGIPTGDITTFIQIMIPLEVTNFQTGCTVVVPKSHKSKKFTDRKTKKFTKIEGEPGDVFIWDGNLWHGSLPNKTNNTRWSLIATFQIGNLNKFLIFQDLLIKKLIKNSQLKKKLYWLFSYSFKI